MDIGGFSTCCLADCTYYCLFERYKFGSLFSLLFVLLLPELRDEVFESRIAVVAVETLAIIYLLGTYSSLSTLSCSFIPRPKTACLKLLKAMRTTVTLSKLLLNRLFLMIYSTPMPHILWIS